MASKLDRLKQGLLVCFLVSLAFHGKALAFDKKESTALSHYIMAAMYEQLGDIDTSVQEFKKALKSDNKSSLIHINLASLYIKQNEIPKAIEELNYTVKLEPGAVEPHAILALLYSSENKTDLASSEYETALKNASKREPGNVDIYKTLGAIYLQQRRLKEAQEAFRLILDLAPDDAQAHFYLGSVYEELKERPKAILELKKSIKLNPDYPEALNSLGYLYVEDNQNLTDAEAMIKKALTMDPENGAYIDSLGWLHFKQGKFEEAAKELEKAASLSNDPVICGHLGDAYFKAGNAAGAKSSWQKSLKLDPKQDNIKEKLDKLK
jgi:Tfp pilus assembly protein PilF